jgi:AraC-like DNA-binding protein
MNFTDVKTKILSQSPLAPLQILKHCEYPTGLKSGFHSLKHNFQTLLIFDGVIHFQEDGGAECPYSSGDLIVIPPGVGYRWMIKEKTLMFQCMHKGFTFSEYNELAGLFGHGTKRLTHVDIGLKKASSFREKIDKLLSEDSSVIDIYFSLACFDLFTCALEACAIFSGKVENGHPAIGKAIDYMRSNLDRNVSLLELSRNSFLGISRLSQLFRESIGMSPMQYMAKLRVEKAMELLLTTGMSIGEISDSLGFNSINYFSRFFKRQTGHSPQEARNRNIV